VKSPLLGPTSAEQEANDEVLCVNPALSVQGEGAGPLLRYESTTPLPGFPAPSGPHVTTPWVSMPGQYTGECKHTNGASWLQLTSVGGAEDNRELVTEAIGPEWGTHLQDVNVALGNLVAMTAAQSATYQAETFVAPESTPAPVTQPPPLLTPTPLAPAVVHKVAKPPVHHRRATHKPKRRVKRKKQKRKAARHKPQALVPRPAARRR
jgi:hypothetical protein